ncbi:MAG: UDP-N-acetylglucosamine--N-acetylmuramyl-(pentapeptide) pyrophosphoryl-undecaprenol N-acetylglucosamine transferase [Rhabdochlamydiaceae bacterium]|nr:UDP-N-acetylglucosamine--N-acetylmuramyl-(pentapeptide) pyrophosphoryl-undecaprenol N-acetylglucosamine transferase [Rhabdochlamydiaceae bacterium]
MNRQKKVIIAAGGTGGHLFPAQALADDLKQSSCEVLFAGANLSTNRYFSKGKYRFCDVQSATVFRRNLKAVFQALITLVKGVRQGWILLTQEAPDLVVGFGSFHSFSVLCAAYLKKVPYVLFESNAFPGKVNRLFSKKALATAISFPAASKMLRGNVVPVQMPVGCASLQCSRSEALSYFGLKEDLLTIVVFGGSQGACFLNECFVQAAYQCAQEKVAFQVIHFAGNLEAAEKARSFYEENKILSCVKDFEPRMELAYKVASIAVARAGAATVSELIAFAVPSILVPYPHAAEDHQTKNAMFLTDEVKGAIYVPESLLTPDVLSAALKELIGYKCREMKIALSQYQSRQHKDLLCHLICRTLQNL